MWTPFVICQRYIKFGRSEVGTGLYPQALFLVLFNVAGRRIRVCGLLSRCWMVDSDFFFVCVCPSSDSGWDGRVCSVVVRKVCLPDCGWDGHV